MIKTKRDKKALFEESKISVGDVFGWKAIIFLPQSTTWKVFIMVIVSISCSVALTEVFFRISTESMIITELICDWFYCMDTVCATLHFGMTKTRNLRHGAKRPFIFLAIDYFSLVPFDVLYDYLRNMFRDKPSDIHYIFRANVVLRVYRIPKEFHDIKQSVSKIITYYLITFAEIFVYLALIAHFLSFFMYEYFDEEQKKKCMENLSACIIEFNVLSLTLLDHNYIDPLTEFPLETYWVLILIHFLVGYFYVFGYVIPMVIYVNILYLKKYFDLSTKRKQLNSLIYKMTDDKALKKKIMNYFHYVLKFDRHDNFPQILNILPLSHRKSFFCDLHWDAITHSDLLEGLSLGCKRSLALYMKTEFVVAGTELLEIGQKKTFFMYVESGMLQIMAAENVNSPLLSLSEGTVLGEISFFSQLDNNAVLRTGKFSVIHFLKFTDLYRVLLNYPNDSAILFRKVRIRLQVARAVEKAKEFGPLFSESVEYSLMTKTNLQWLKRRIRSIMKLKKMEELKMKTSKNVIETHSLFESRIDHTSMYLSLLALPREEETLTEPVCLRNKFPWLLNPHSSFIKVWNKLILGLAVFILLVFPAFLGWYPEIPPWFFNIAVVINFIYILDVLMKFVTAVTIKGLVTIKFSVVANHRISSASFYLDVLSALPLYHLSHIHKSLRGPFKLNLLLSNLLIKSYKLLPFINRVTYSSRPGIFYRACLKYILIMYFTIYWMAAMLQLVGIECVFYDCKERDWFATHSLEKEGNYRTIVSIFVAVYLVLDLPQKAEHMTEFPSFVIFSLGMVILSILHFAWQGGCTSCYVLGKLHNLEYRNLVMYVLHFMQKRKVAAAVQKRVLATMDFEWYCDGGNYVKQARSISEDFSPDLTREVNRKFLVPTLQKSRLFKWEDDQFVVNLCKKSRLLVMPAGSLLLTFGTQSMTMYVIYKGYIQINSFLAADSHFNVSTPFVLKSGDTVPVLVALSQLPSPITVITLTDCEILTFNLEDILTTMINYGVLPDVVQALKDTDLTAMSSAKLGLSRIEDPTIVRASYTKSRRHQHGIKTFLMYVLLKKGINPRSKFYICWETIRCIHILFNLVCWPIAFGSSRPSHINLTFINVLLVLDIVASVCDFYLRLHTSYYNQMGIYVNHPLSTLQNYLTSSFILDLIAFIPNLHMIHILRMKPSDFTLGTVLSHIIMRTVSIYRILGILSYMYGDYKWNLAKSLTLCSVFFLGLHYYLCVMMYLYFRGKEKFMIDFTPEPQYQFTQSYEFYFYEFLVALSVLLNCQVFFRVFSVICLVKIVILGTIAVVFQTLIYSILTLYLTGTRERFATEQYYLRSFVKFLKDQKVEDNTTNEGIEYFKFKWEKLRGMDMHTIFSQFPYTLHEDILFPVYKDTFSAAWCFSGANEAFYRILSRSVQDIVLMKASVVIFEKQVQGDIFFIHKGKCFVEEISKVLIKGAVIGDIKGCGLMTHTIKSLTNVELLRIPSKTFFEIIENFYETERAFASEVTTADDFIESVYFDPNTISPEYIDSILRPKKYSDAEFETTKGIPVDYNEIVPGKKKVKRLLLPNSFTVRMLKMLFFIDAYITFIVNPIFIATALLTWWSLTIIYILDVIWIVKIILTCETAILNPKTGDYVHEKKVVIRHYLRKFDGMVLDVLSVIPIELIVVACYRKSVISEHCNVMFYCYFNRLLRIPYLHYYVISKRKELLTNVYLKLLNVLVFGISLLNIFVCVSLLLKLTRDSSFTRLHCHWGVSREKVDAVLTTYLIVLNEFVSGGLTDWMPDTPLKIAFHMMIGLFAAFSKALVINQVLIIVYVTHFSKSNQLIRLQELEKYLQIRDVSPALVRSTFEYCTNLLNSYNEAAHPRLLNEVPVSIKIKIMEQLYIHDLENCYIFEGIEKIFLKQLAARLERFIFFPGDYIVEKGDVDQNMYFIHKGEVKCLEIDETYPVLERIVNLHVSGESFGVKQGLYLSCPHRHSYRAKILSDILVLNFNKWEDMREAFPETTECIYKRSKEGSRGSKSSNVMKSTAENR